MCEPACLWMCAERQREKLCMFGCRRQCMWLHKGRLKKKRDEETCAPLQWKYLTHGWWFIIANDSVVLSGSHRSITHRAREEIEMKSVSSSIFIHLFFCLVLCTRCEFKENTVNPHNAVTMSICALITKVISLYCAPHRTAMEGQDHSSVTAASVIFGENAKDS